MFIIKSNRRTTQATKFAAKSSLLLCRLEMFDLAGAFMTEMQSCSKLSASLAKCQYFSLALAWHSFGIRDHAKSAAIFASISAKNRNLDRNVLIELMILRSAQLLVPGPDSPYLKDAQTWETPQVQELVIVQWYIFNYENVLSISF